jgi:hypothetical protein
MFSKMILERKCPHLNMEPSSLEAGLEKIEFPYFTIFATQLSQLPYYQILLEN